MFVFSNHVWMIFDDRLILMIFVNLSIDVIYLFFFKFNCTIKNYVSVIEIVRQLYEVATYYFIYIEMFFYEVGK